MIRAANLRATTPISKTMKVLATAITRPPVSAATRAGEIDGGAGADIVLAWLTNEED